MRASLFLATLIVASASSASLALQGSDTMAAWQGASAEQKAKLVGELLRLNGSAGSSASVIHCLDAASNVVGHADLPIVEVAKACRSNGGDPV